MLKYSKLKHELELLDLTHKHEIQILTLKHSRDKEELLSKCVHKYEDGASAMIFCGTQWNNYDKCAICNKSL